MTTTRRRTLQRLAAAARSTALGFTLVLSGLSAAQAASEAPTAAADPVLEAQVQRITAELRCLVCQNQTIADSHADLAVDLRNQVREMVRRGDSQDQILSYMTARYGDFVLYRPPVKTQTLLLWFGPAALLVVSVGVFITVLRRRSRMAPDRFEPDPEDAPS